MVGGCTATSPFPGITDTRQSAIARGFTESHIDTGQFTLLVLHRGLKRHDVQPVVYIEGDGRGFITRRRVSADPTPRDPVALRMALTDPAPAVVYIARPCQYIMTPECRPEFWTTHRYAEAVLDAVDGAVNDLQQQDGFDRFALVGYSGGGVVAALLAQRRNDVNWLVTVSAPLDHAAWTAHHGDTPLSGSLNPANVKDRLSSLPQLHLAGANDSTVPPFLIEDYVRDITASTPVEFRTISGMTHNGWPANWRELICESAFWREACSQE